jgi:hypothetical protein
MKNASSPKEASALDSAKFTGTNNPRQQRALVALDKGPMPRQSLDNFTGSANSPDLILDLRRKGLEIPCERVACIDRDGRPCRPGVYHLSESDRRKISSWLASRG